MKILKECKINQYHKYDKKKIEHTSTKSVFRFQYYLALTNFSSKISGTDACETGRISDPLTFDVLTFCK